MASFSKLENTTLSTSAPLSFNHFIFQYVCDANNIFTYVNAVMPGAVHDAYVFRRSALRVELEAGLIQNYFMLGDAGLVSTDETSMHSLAHNLL